LGSVRQLTTQDGNVGLTQSFDPFGNSVSVMGPDASNYGYAGEWADATELQFLRARYYTPSQGRFLTRDPFPGILLQPATFNPYLYVVNNPVLITDPSGEIAPILILGALGFAGGAILNTWQQTNGFTSWCHVDVMQALAWGVGGAAAVSAFAIMSVGAVGMAGLGLQGIAIGLYSLGITTPSVASLWLSGATAIGLSSTAATWLFTSRSPIEEIRQILSQTANQARVNIGDGSGALYGTKLHTEFRKQVNALGNIDLHTEVSYANGRVVRYGTPGSVRVDVVYGGLTDPLAIFDLKTGMATLSSARIIQLRAHHPYVQYSILEVRP
jgi:RHS repeat-associated protein